MEPYTPAEIRLIRQALKLTQKQMAERLGITRSYLSQLEMQHGMLKPGKTLNLLLKTMKGGEDDR